MPDSAAASARYRLLADLFAAAEPSLTRDLDVAVEGDADAEALVRALAADGYGTSAVVEQERVGRLATVRLVAPGEKVWRSSWTSSSRRAASSRRSPPLSRSKSCLDWYYRLTRVGHRGRDLHSALDDWAAESPARTPPEER